MAGGRPISYRYRGERLLDSNFSLRVTPSEMQLLAKRAAEVNCKKAEVIRGFIHQLADQPIIKDGVPLVINDIPMVLRREEAKELLKDLAFKLL